MSFRKIIEVLTNSWGWSWTKAEGEYYKIIGQIWGQIIAQSNSNQWTHSNFISYKTSRQLKFIYVQHSGKSKTDFHRLLNRATPWPMFYWLYHYTQSVVQTLSQCIIKQQVWTEHNCHPTVNNPGLITKYYEALGTAFGRHNIALFPSGWSCWPWQGTSSGSSGKSICFPMLMSY